MNLHRFFRICVAGFTLLISGSALIKGQSITGTILGTVRDSSTAVITGLQNPDHQRSHQRGVHRGVGSHRRIRGPKPAGRCLYGFGGG